MNAAALAAALELGVQPALFHTDAGAPLYSPYGLAQTIPAMALAHLVVAGPVEAILTAAVFGYLARANPAALSPLTDAAAPTPAARWTTSTKVGIGFVATLALLSPLGLLAPGGAFGEAAPEDLPLTELGLDAVPEGMARFAGFWSHALLGDYGFADGDNAALAYLVSALIGILVVGLAVLVVARLATRRSPAPAAGDPSPSAHQ
jgi:cobalt/nickel transport system permease protein